MCNYLRYAYRYFRRRSARGGGIRICLSATRQPQLGMRPFRDSAGADVGTSVQRFCGFYLELVTRVAEKGKDPPGQRSAMPGKAIVRAGLSTPYETGLVFDPGPSQADSWHGPYYIVVRPGVRWCFLEGRCCVGYGFL